jgi:hypothetical protein
MAPYGERCASPEFSFYIFPSKSQVNEPPPFHIPHQVPYGERSLISRANGLFIHVYLSGSPIRTLPQKMGKNIWPPSTEPRVDERPTYIGMQPGYPRGSFKILHSLPQCRAAFSTIPSTLAWVDQSPVSQPVSQQPSSGYALHNCYCLPHDPG